MIITDKNGKEIEVTDLDAAIEQTDYFKDTHHIPPVPSDKERHDYWQDIYDQLIAIKSGANKDVSWSHSQEREV